MSEEALEARARRAAKRVGLVATKSRWRADSPDNLGGFQIVEGNQVIRGARYELSAQDVIDYCRERGDAD